MPYLFALGFIAGQLLKLPFFNFGGLTLLDLILGFFCLICLLQIKSIPKIHSIYLKTGLIFISLCLISLLFSPLKLSPLEKLVSFSYTIRFFIYLLSSFFISQNFYQLKKNTSNILIYSGLILAILGILQFIFIPNLSFLSQYGWDPHIFRTVSTFLDPNFVGAFFGLTLILILLNPQKLKRNRQIIFFSLVFIALDTTFSRSSYLLFIISFLTLSLFTKSIKKSLLTIILSLILLISFLVYQHLIAIPKNVNRAQSAEARVSTWQQGWEIFNRAPILGVGFNSYRFALREYSLAPANQINSHGGASNDSSLLFVADTTGIIGFFSFLGFLGSIFYLSYQQGRQKNFWGLTIISGLFGLIAQSFFADTLFYPALLAWLMLSCAQLKTSA